MVRSSWIVRLSPVRLRDLVGSRDQAAKDTGSLSDSGMGDGRKARASEGIVKSKLIEWEDERETKVD